MNSSCSIKPLPLVWTVGFTGKRNLPPNREPVVRDALDKALTFLALKAREHAACLTAVSSVARGTDVIFAEACVAREPAGTKIHWKCLVPYGTARFLHHDMKAVETPHGLTAEERHRRLRRALACIRASYLPAPECTRVGDDPAFHQNDERETAYLECGYRTVDEADVMIVIVNNDEFGAFTSANEQRLEELARWRASRDTATAAWKKWMMERAVLKGAGYKGPIADRPEVSPKPIVSLPRPVMARAGTVAVARYALAANRPTIILNANDPSPWENRLIIKDDADDEKNDWFYDPDVTQTVKRSLETCVHAEPSMKGREVVKKLLDCLDASAMNFQNESQKGLRNMLALHLAASCVAALFATVLDFQPFQWVHLCKAVIWLLVLLAALKPALAFRALRIEDGLHKGRTRDHWVKHRTLAEVCRSALDRWDLPVQPLDAMDEEDFPKIKRLIRSLRLLRQLEDDPALRRGRKRPSAQLLDTAMREACETYVRTRITGQAHYFEDKQWEAAAEEKRWRGRFRKALGTAIGVGVILVAAKMTHALNAHHQTDVHWPFRDVFHWLEAVVIIAPFYATYALGQITVSDCRRRSLRYDEMHHYLLRLSRTLLACEATSSRLRIIEHAERMLIEEQHEWFSVTRNYSV